MSLQKHIKDLVFFYVKTNYNNYLEVNGLQYIPDEDVDSVINKLYDDRKEHLKKFVQTSSKQLLKDEYPGDQSIANILLNVFQDDELCKNRILVEIRLHQQKYIGGKNDYSKIL